MISALDTNVILGLKPTDTHHINANAAVVDRLTAGNTLIVSSVVYAELLAGPNLRPVDLDAFLRDNDIILESELPHALFIKAGLAYKDYASRRKASGSGESRRLLADFLVAVHAQAYANELLTFDPKFYRLNFPSLSVPDLAKPSISLGHIL